METNSKQIKNIFIKLQFKVVSQQQIDYRNMEYKDQWDNKTMIFRRK